MGIGQEYAKRGGRFYLLNRDRRSFYDHRNKAYRLGWDLASLQGRPQYHRIKNAFYTWTLWVKPGTPYQPEAIFGSDWHAKTERECWAKGPWGHIETKSHFRLRCFQPFEGLYEKFIKPGDPNLIKPYQEVIKKLKIERERNVDLSKKLNRTPYKFDSRTIEMVPDVFADTVEGFTADNIVQALDMTDKELSKVNGAIVENTRRAEPIFDVLKSYKAINAEAEKNTEEVKKDKSQWETEHINQLQNEVMQINGQNEQMEKLIKEAGAVDPTVERNREYFISDYQTLHYMNRYVLIWIYFALAAILSYVMFASAPFSAVRIALFSIFLIVFPFIIYPLELFVMHVYRGTYNLVMRSPYSNE